MIKRSLFFIVFFLFFAGIPYAATYYGTSTGAGDYSGDSWANAMAESHLETSWEGSASAGDIYYIKGGETYDFSSNAISTSLDGTATSLIRVIGVVGESTTPATGTDRPTFSMTSETLSFDDYWSIENLIITTTSSTGLKVDDGAVVINCKVTNSSGTANRRAIYVSETGGTIINSEAISTNGIAIYLGSDANIFYSYIHDSTTGIFTYADGNTVVFSIVDTCTTGILIEDENRNVVLNNTLYNGTTGISGTTGYVVARGNIINGFTTGASWTTAQDENIFDYNNWYGNTADVSNVTKGSNATAVNPNFTDAPNGDFSLQAGSGCLDAAEVITLGVD